MKADLINKYDNDPFASAKGLFIGDDSGKRGNGRRMRDTALEVKNGI